MLIKEITAKLCMTKSKITDYVINPYTGCQHGCLYCYAVFIKKFQDIYEPWGDFVFIKKNCCDLLPMELKKNKEGTIWLSSVTDLYQPIEGREKLTRRILEIIAKSPYKIKYNIEVLTKSALLTRDIDLFKDLNADVGISVNTCESTIAKIIEPYASAPHKRIEAIKKAKKEGIKVHGFISPVLPGITILEPLFKELVFCDYIMLELLNTTPAALGRLVPAIKKYFPKAIDDLKWAMNKPQEHYDSICKEVDGLQKKYKVSVTQIVRHDVYMNTIK